MMSDYVCPECGLTHGDSECRASAAAPPREPSPAAIDAFLIKARTQTILGDVVKWYMADDASEEARRALLRDVIERVRALLDDLRRTP